MKKLVIALLFTAAAVTPALAERYTLVRDTVGNCSAVVSSSHYPGMKIMRKAKYSSMDAANKALGGVKGCSGLVR